MKQVALKRHHLATQNSGKMRANLLVDPFKCFKFTSTQPTYSKQSCEHQNKISRLRHPGRRIASVNKYAIIIR